MRYVQKCLFAGWVGAWIAGVGSAAEPSPRARFYTERLTSPRPMVRRAAARSLAALADRSTVSTLSNAVSDEDPQVRAEAAKALGRIGDRRGLDALLARTADSDTTVRFYVAYALGEIGDSRAVKPLLAMLDDRSWLVRDQAAWAVRQVADAALAPELVRLLIRVDTEVSHIQWLLRHVCPQACIPHLSDHLSEGDGKVRLRIVRTLAALSSQAAVEPLRRALDDRDAGVRLAAIEGLLATGDESLEPAFKRLAADDPEPRVRLAAEEALLALALAGDLTAYWSFNDKDSRTATDMTRRGIDGDIRGCEVAPGKSGAALTFRNGAFIELGKPPAMPIAERDLTIMAWAKSETPNGVVVARGGAFCGFSLYIKDGVPRFGIHRFEEGPAYIAAGEQNVVGRWVHLAGVIREDRIELFVDGKRAAVQKTPGYLPSDCGQGMEIGFDAGNSPAEIVDHFQGIIDEVKVFHAALDETDLVKHWKLDP